jgi:hypothetical protein
MPKAPQLGRVKSWINAWMFFCISRTLTYLPPASPTTGPRRWRDYLSDAPAVLSVNRS